MGLIWAAERVSPPSPPIPDDWILQPSFIHLEAEGPNDQRAELTITRHSAGPGATRRAIRVDGLVGILFLPPGAGPHRSVLVLHGGGGIDEYTGAMLASRGYAAFNLSYFSEPGLPRGLVNIPLEYFENAIRWMRAQPWLGNGFLAVWEPSRGGELELLLGATFPDINAVSAWVPSGIMFWPIGLAENDDPRPPASWTFRGKPLPYLQENNESVEPLPPQQPGQPEAYTPIHLRHLRDEHAVERATIPVENIRGPILLVSGTDDQMWPSSVLADIAMRRLESNGFRFPFQHLKYEGAVISFYCPTDRERRTSSVSRPKALAAFCTRKETRRGPTPRLARMPGIGCCNSWRPAPRTANDGRGTSGNGFLPDLVNQSLSQNLPRDPTGHGKPRFSAGSWHRALVRFGPKVKSYQECRGFDEPALPPA
jgi:hypothetical protein